MRSRPVSWSSTAVTAERLQPDRKTLLEEFRYVDLARKVVGVGSVGTRCWILLLLGRDDGDPLFLQVKETGPSVLEPLLGRSQFRNHGQRVVEGQRLMQAASDIFLGWIRNKAGLGRTGSATSMSGSSGTGRRRSTSRRSSPVGSSSTHRLAAGRSRGRTPARETASRSRRTSARATPSTELLPTSPSRTPTRTNAITQHSSKLRKTAESKRRRVYSSQGHTHPSRACGGSPVGEVLQPRTVLAGLQP